MNPVDPRGDVQAQSPQRYHSGGSLPLLVIYELIDLGARATKLPEYVLAAVFWGVIYPVFVLLRGRAL